MTFTFPETRAPFPPLRFLSDSVTAETNVTVRNGFRMYPSPHPIPSPTLYKRTRKASPNEPSHPLPGPRPPADLFAETQHLPSVFNGTVRVDSPYVWVPQPWVQSIGNLFSPLYFSAVKTKQTKSL